MSDHKHDRRERADHRAAKRYAPPQDAPRRPHDPRSAADR